MLYAPREQGQGLAEYAIILMLIAIVLIAIVTLLGEEIVALYSKIIAEWPPFAS